MKVKLYGFQWTPAAISIEDFFTFLKTLEGQERHYLCQARIVYTAELNGYHIGIILSAKSEKRFCELATAAKSFKVHVTDLKKNRRFVSFNFFIVNKNTGRGLYQHYFQSASMPTFHDFFKRLYNEKKDDDKQKAMRDNKANGDNKKEDRAIRSKYHKSIKMVPLYKKADFEALVKGLKEITRIQFDLDTMDFLEPWFRQATGRMKKRRESVSFSKGSKAPLVDGIMAMVGDEETGPTASDPVIANLTVTGVDPLSEDDVTYSLNNNIESFGEFDFDDVANEVTLDIASIAESPMIRDMLAAAEKHKVLFETKAE